MTKLDTFIKSILEFSYGDLVSLATAVTDILEDRKWEPTDGPAKLAEALHDLASSWEVQEPASHDG